MRGIVQKYQVWALTDQAACRLWAGGIRLRFSLGIRDIYLYTFAPLSASVRRVSDHHGLSSVCCYFSVIFCALLSPFLEVRLIGHVFGCYRPAADAMPTRVALLFAWLPIVSTELLAFSAVARCYGARRRMAVYICSPIKDGALGGVVDSAPPDGSKNVNTANVNVACDIQRHAMPLWRVCFTIYYAFRDICNY